MALALLDGLRRVEDDLLSQATRQFPRPDGIADAAFVERHLADLMGLPNLWATSWTLTTARGETFVIVDSLAPPQQRQLLPTDRGLDFTFSDRFGLRKGNMEHLRHELKEATDWFHASPSNRVVTDTIFHNEMAILMAWVRLDITVERSADQAVVVSAVGSLPANLLHDVVSVLHGRDRRITRDVCRSWRRAASDSLLPVDDADVRAWVVPRFVVMTRAYPKFAPTKLSVEMLWALTRYWLEGGE
jgi:hypothetical protein